MGNRQSRRKYFFTRRPKESMLISREVQTEAIKVWIPNLRDCVDLPCPVSERDKLDDLFKTRSKIENSMNIFPCGDAIENVSSIRSEEEIVTETNNNAGQQGGGIRCDSRIQKHDDRNSPVLFDSYEDNGDYREPSTRSASFCVDTSSAELEEFLAAENWCKDCDEESQRSDSFHAETDDRYYSEADLCTDNYPVTKSAIRPGIQTASSTFSKTFNSQTKMKQTKTAKDRKPPASKNVYESKTEFFYKPKAKNSLPPTTRQSMLEMKRPGVNKNPELGDKIEYTFYIEDNAQSVKPFRDRRISSLININGCTVNLLEQENGKKKFYYKGMPVQPVIVRVPTMMDLKRCLGLLDTQFPHFNVRAFLPRE